MAMTINKSKEKMGGGGYELINPNTNESHGVYETLEEAQGAVKYDRLLSYSIWFEDVLVECLDCQ